MRYVRFGSESQIAALIFGLFEEARVSKSKRINNNLECLFKNLPECNKKIIDFARNARVPNEDILSMWNCSGYLFQTLKSLINRACGLTDRISFLTVKHFFDNIFGFHFEPLKELRSNLPKKNTIYWDEAGGGIALFYRRYSMESLVVSPCIHVQVKHELFAEMRGLMSGPMDKEGFRHAQILCRHENCGRDLSAFIFDTGKREAEQVLFEKNQQIIQFLMDNSMSISSKYPKRRSAMNLCQFCGVRASKYRCTNSCEICLQCAVISLFTQLQFACPCCGQKFKRENFGEIWESAMRVPSPRLSVRFLTCEMCYTDCEIENFMESVRGNHACLLCGICWNNLKTTKICEVCENDVSAGSELAIIEAGTAVIERITCIRCNRQENLNEFTHSKHLSHWQRCKVCDFCLATYLNEELKNDCMICNSPYNDNDFIELSSLFPTVAHKNTTPASKQSSEDTCIVCHITKNNINFSIFDKAEHQCRVCNDCYNYRCFKECPSCLVGLFFPARSDEEKTCLKCKVAKSSGKFTLYTKLRHKCIVCDQCFSLNRGNFQCPVCPSNYEYTDRSEILSKTRSAAVLSEQTKCECGRTKDRKRIFCNNFCICSYCILRSYFLFGLENCYICGQRITGQLQDSVECSNCCKSLTIKGTKLSVFGICLQSGCILCILCVHLNEGRPFCSICTTEIQVKDLDEIQREQKEYLLACDCKELSYKFEELSCGHSLHPTCKRRMFRCRICRAEINENAEIKTLKDYL